MMTTTARVHANSIAAAALAALVLVACSGSGSSDTVTVNGDVPIAYVMRSVSVGMNPTDAANSAARWATPPRWTARPAARAPAPGAGTSGNTT